MWQAIICMHDTRLCSILVKSREGLEQLLLLP